jgi:hypothetical protein
MLTSKRFLIVVALLFLAVVAAVFYLGRNAKLEAQLAEERDLLRERSARLDSYRSLGTGDSLLREGNYEEALAIYRDLQSDTAWMLGTATLTSRIDHARRLREVGAALDTLRRMRARRLRPEAPDLTPVQPQTVTRMPLEASDPNQYDSLRFALQKADMQIRNLESRLRTTSGGNYLTFTSRQGNEVYYVGNIKNGKANGRGVALLSSGSRYLGEWENNMKHGVGEFHWPDGASYEGEYENDMRSGQGTYRFPDGSVFVGEWEDDLRSGEGIFYDKKGEVVARGVWEDDELVEESR